MPGKAFGNAHHGGRGGGLLGCAGEACAVLRPFFLAALLAACAVSIGGLIASHIARLIYKASFSRLIAFSFWLGSMLMLVCDKESC